MLEKDNFNFTGFIRNNPLLNESFEGFGGYKDLKPVNELDSNEKVGKEPAGDQYDGQYDDEFGPEIVDEAEGEENAWMSEVDGTEAYAVGEWKCYYDHPGVLVWSYGDIPLEKFSIYATPGWEDPNSTPIQVDVNQDTVDNMSLPQGTFADFSEYAEAMTPALEKIESAYSDDMSDGSSMNELEKPQKIYADDEADSSYDNTDRMMDLGGEQIEKNIMFLLDDGFDPGDVLEMCKMFIDAHSEAADQGKKF